MSTVTYLYVGQDRLLLHCFDIKLLLLLLLLLLGGCCRCRGHHRLPRDNCLRVMEPRRGRLGHLGRRGLAVFLGGGAIGHLRTVGGLGLPLLSQLLLVLPEK